VLLVFLLIRLIRQEPMTWSGFRALYFAAYTVAVAITLTQWMLNTSLSRALREAHKNHAKAVRSQSFLKERTDELAAVNAALQKRTLQLQTAVQISQATASWLELEELVQHSVKLVRERFDLYYVGLYLVDESKQWAVLRASTGEAGRGIPPQGHRLEVGDTSTVGGCIARAQVHGGPDLDTASDRSPIKASSLLPGARSQIALPLRSRGRAIGALDVQSTAHEAFSHEDIAVLQMVADQLAVVIDNARLFSETRTRLEKMGARQRRAVQDRWADAASAQVVPSHERIRPDVTPLGRATVPQFFGESDQVDSSELSRAIEQVLAHQETLVQSDTGEKTGQAAVVVPLSLRGEVIGALGLHEPEGGRRWTADEIALVEAVADQMALALENARLLAETQQRARRDRLIAAITAKVRSSRDPETILRTAVRELAAALGTDRALVQVGTGTPSDELS
jgi:GAF domain-containing protein